MAADIQTNFAGTWTYEKSENFNEYIEKLGLGSIQKTAAKKVSPTTVISVDGDSITVSISAGSKSNKATFKLGEEYALEGETGAGMAITTYADKKMTTVISPNDSTKKLQTVVGEIENGQLVQMCTAACGNDNFGEFVIHLGTEKLLQSMDLRLYGSLLIPIFIPFYILFYIPFCISYYMRFYISVYIPFYIPFFIPSYIPFEMYLKTNNQN